MTIPQQACPWGLTYADVALYCPGAPVISETFTEEMGAAALAAAEAAVNTATGGRFGVCTRTARPCSGGCGGSCGCCGTGRYDRIDLDPLGRTPVVSVTQVQEGATVLAESEYGVIDSRWLIRMPAGTRWARQADIAAAPPDLEIMWSYGTPPPPDLLINAVVPLACELAKKLAGGPCSIPDEVVSVSREGAQFVMTDLTTLVSAGLIGPPSTLAAIKRAHPWGALIQGPPAGMFDPATAEHGGGLIDIVGGTGLTPVSDEFDRIRGDAWLWDYDANMDTSDWSDLVVYIRYGPTEDDDVLFSTESGGGITTPFLDFETGRISWLVSSVFTEDSPVGMWWIEASATLPEDGGPFTIVPARRLRVRPQVAT